MFHNNCFGKHTGSSTQEDCDIVFHQELYSYFYLIFREFGYTTSNGKYMVKLWEQRKFRVNKLTLKYSPSHAWESSYLFLQLGILGLIFDA